MMCSTASGATRTTRVIACAVGADLSANSLLNYHDNHENFAAEAAPTELGVRVKSTLGVTC